MLKKLRQLDLLNQLLPILWKKNQIETVLKALDGVKDRVADEEKIEAQKLLEKESKIDEQLDKSLKSGTLPGKDLFNEVNSDISKMTAIRALIAHQNEDDVYTAMDKALTDGQKKEIANTLDPSIVDPKIKVADLSQEAKIRFFVRYIMLDPLTYDLLIKLESLPFTQ